MATGRQCLLIASHDLFALLVSTVKDANKFIYSQRYLVEFLTKHCFIVFTQSLHWY